jgi:hypothetical protein
MEINHKITNLTLTIRMTESEALGLMSIIERGIYQISDEMDKNRNPLIIEKELGRNIIQYLKEL